MRQNTYRNPSEGSESSKLWTPWVSEVIEDMDEKSRRDPARYDYDPTKQASQLLVCALRARLAKDAASEGAFVAAAALRDFEARTITGIEHQGGQPADLSVPVYWLS